MSDVRVREERPSDHAAVQDILVAAFPSPGEAALVDALRGRTNPQISLVAEREERVAGHIFFTPVRIGESGGAPSALGLGPMAVAPGRQRQGVGAALVTAGLDACRDAGVALVVVLGHPDYYPRFGFVPAWDHGLYYAEPGPNPAFRVRALADGALAGVSGEVRYHDAFAGL